MRSSPFEIFRRNQKQLMVALTGLSMFAFLFLDMSGSGQIPTSLSVFAVATLFGFAGWFLGSPRGRGADWAMIAAVIGALVAFIGLRSAHSQPAVLTSVGNFSRDDIQRLGNRRQIANQFVSRVAQLIGMNPPLFGQVGEEALAELAIRLKQADEQGVHLGDAAVNDYIRVISRNQLSEKDFKQILRELRVPEGAIFDVLRDELRAQLVSRLSAPQPISNSIAPLQTPAEYWKIFQRMNVKQGLSAVAVPVAPFLAQVATPRDEELTKFFEEHKNSPTDNPRRAGFRQPRKVVVEYVAAEYEAFESQVTPPKDDEVTEYYEKNKRQYLVRSIPDGDDLLPNLPGSTPEAGTAPPASPVDALSPTNTPAEPATTVAAPAEPATTPAPSEAPATEAPATEAPATDAPATPDATDSSASPPATNEPTAPGEPGAALPRRGLDVQTVSFKQATEGDAATTPAAEPAPADAAPAEAAPAVEVPVTPEAPATPDAPALPETPAATETPATEKPATETPATETPNTPALGLPEGSSLALPGLPEPAPIYRPLDENLRVEISEKLIKERTLEKMAQAADAALEYMLGLNELIQGAADDAARKKIETEVSAKLKTYAESNRLRYARTAPMSQFQLQSSTSETIGQATEPNPNARFGGLSVAADVFGSEMTFAPRRANAPASGSRYAYWKVDDEAEHVPTFAEAGIREAVEAAWKQEQAGKLAQERAAQLSDLLRKTVDDVPAALAGQTVTGAKEGDVVTVLEVPKFSWLELPESTPFELGFPRFPRPAQPKGIQQPSLDFFKLACESLAVGEVGVAPNEDRSIYYVVKVTSRDPLEATEGVDADQIKELQSRFVSEPKTGPRTMPTPYDIISFESTQRLNNEWVNRFLKKYNIEVIGRDGLVTPMDE